MCYAATKACSDEVLISRLTVPQNDVHEVVKAELPEARVIREPDWPRFGGFA